MKLQIKIRLTGASPRTRNDSIDLKLPELLGLFGRVRAGRNKLVRCVVLVGRDEETAAEAGVGFADGAAFTVQNSSSAIAAGRVLFAFESVLRCGGVTLRTYLSFLSCIEQTSHVSFRLDVCARCATMSATTWLVAENDRASILCLLASFSRVQHGRYWTICCKMGYTLLRVVLGFVFMALVIVYEESRPRQRALFPARRFCGDAASTAVDIMGTILFKPYQDLGEGLFFDN